MTTKFTGVSFADLVPPDDGHWESCHFEQCQFSGLKIARQSFIDCTFTGCDLSNMIPLGAQFSGVSFRGCKMIGIRWTEIDPLLFSVRFEDCNLSYSDFFGLKLKKQEMLRCKAHGVHFEDADLSAANLRETDFEGAFFSQTNLTKADFTDARNYAIDPLTNKIKGAIFRFPEAASLLHALGVKIV